MPVLHSFRDLPATLSQEDREAMAARSIASSLVRWALSPDYRAVVTTSGQTMHKRFEQRTTEDLLAKVQQLPEDLRTRVQKLPTFRGCLWYLCPDEHRPGKPLDLPPEKICLRFAS